MVFKDRSDFPEHSPRGILRRARISLLLFAGACSAVWIRADLPAVVPAGGREGATTEPGIVCPSVPGTAVETPAGATIRASASATSSPSHDLAGRVKAASDLPEGSIATIVRDDEPMIRALAIVRSCRDSFAKVRDYTCTFYKRELLRGRLSPLNVMNMKARTEPRSIYFKFEEPNRGREAIYVHGRNRGNVLVHEAGLVKLLAGTMEVAPTSARALQENRHPITDAGIGNLIDTVIRRWELELSPRETVLVFDPSVIEGGRRCLMVEALHPQKQPHFQFYKIRLFIDTLHNLPIRFEGYDWPAEAGGPAILAEEYAYGNLKLNVGLNDLDFDVANKEYAFGRF
ncbi:DUF1571 domain-containing protein [Aquisphaera insulae]|uniref:DUF1571 domain-containing protein n=1 Tax=Aquisphaera insulae TaxID=2712864 RepID=UPI0013EB6789|nr:DUF1571 domain-containing protein [Aquisphaera insulae]